MSLRWPKSTHVHVIRTPSSVLEVRTTSKKAAGGNDGSLSSLGRGSGAAAGGKARLNSYLLLLLLVVLSLALRQTDSRIRKAQDV